MDPLRMSPDRMLASLLESRSTDTLGAAGVALGIALVALGWILEEAAIGPGAAIRTLGGILFLAGLATVIFGDSRRRAVAIGMSKGIVARYMSRTAHWGWPDRVGLAGVTVGLALIVPSVVLQIIFRNGAAVAGPAALIFWVGVALLIYGRFYGRDDEQTRGQSSDSRARGRGGGRL